MSLTAVPDQPLDFTGTRLVGCLCGDPEEAIMFDATDTMSWQMGYQPCRSEVLNGDPDMIGTGWDNNGWTLSAGQACPRNEFGSITDNTFAPTPGSIYIIEVVMSDIPQGYNGPTDVVLASFGGQELGGLAFGQGYTFTITATTAAPLSFYVLALRGQAPCVQIASIFEVAPEITVSLVDDDDTVVASFDYEDFPERFDFDRDRVNIEWPLGEDAVEAGCYTLRVEDGCDETIIEGPRVKVINGGCTMEIRACIQNDIGDLYGPFTTTMRVVGKVARMTAEHQVGQDVLTNGTLSRIYARRNRTYELRIDRIGESGHLFLSSLPMWHHVYLDGAEWVVGTEGYAPGYGDVYDAFGGIIMQVRPKRDTPRGVLCGEDTGGCAPPPNFHVYGTGPNNNYMIQSEENARVIISQ